MLNRGSMSGGSGKKFAGSGTPVRPILGSHMRQVVKQREGHHDNENVHRPHRIPYSFIDTNVDQAALVGTLTSHRFAAIPTLFARVRRLMREGASYSLSALFRQLSMLFGVCQ
jgi:hypothetical protein